MSTNEQKEVTPETNVELTSSETESGAETEVGLEEGNQAPDFELETIDGETVRLSELRGEKILLNFWATWCPHVEQKCLICKSTMKRKMKESSWLLTYSKPNKVFNK